MSDNIYGVISDQHNHLWSAFSETLPSGVNSRLQMTINELLRAAQEVKDRGGKVLFDAGDVFHVRGSLAPSVLNPVEDAYKKIINEMQLEVITLAGNHDMEAKTSHRISNAITPLSNLGVKVINEPTILPEHRVAMLPWNPRLDTVPATPDRQKIVGLRDQILDVKAKILARGEKVSDYALFIHAPLDDVIDGLPNKGFTAAELEAHGFKYVFAGHYHNYKKLSDTVYSIGATTQHNWGDIGAKAGFLIVSDSKGVEWRSTNAPNFISIDATTDPEEIPLIIPGNYVRVTLNSNKASDKNAMRDYLLKAGAAGVAVITSKNVVATATRTAKIEAGATMEGSIAAFVKERAFSGEAGVIAKCLDILGQVRSSKGAA